MVYVLVRLMLFGYVDKVGLLDGESDYMTNGMAGVSSIEYHRIINLHGISYRLVNTREVYGV